MRTRRDAGGLWVVLLERGETIRASLEGLAAQHGIEGARITAVGGLENPEIAYFDLQHKKYLPRTFPGIYELITADGNISLRDGKPFMHMHVAISGRDYIVYGGHLMDAHIGVVMEVFLDPLGQPLRRRMCDDLGIPVWDP